MVETLASTNAREGESPATGTAWTVPEADTVAWTVMQLEHEVSSGQPAKTGQSRAQLLRHFLASERSRRKHTNMACSWRISCHRRQAG
jgi:hypothetical protein